MPNLKLSLLGPMETCLGGQPTDSFTYHKGRALLAYLAVEADRPHLREALADLLWPEMPADAARMNLRKVLNSLREAIEPGKAENTFLITTRDTIQFNAGSDFTLDVTLFLALVKACEQHSHRSPSRCPACAARLEQAAQLYRGDFLAPMLPVDSVPFEEWAILRREALHQHARQALAHLANYHERWGNLSQARQFLLQLLALEPWNEEAHAQAMRLLALEGQRSAALAQYRTCCRVLKEELGVEPLDETRQLYERIRAGIKMSVAEVARLGFPSIHTPLIGREVALAELGNLLGNPATRLVTIVGPGGVGKTRLAVAIAQQYAPVFRDGAIFIDLTDLSAAASLPGAVFALLEITPRPETAPEGQLLAALRGRQCLLVLDNYEHLLPDVHTITQIVRAAPGVVTLLSSRQRLSLHIERVFELDGLEYPKAAQPDDPGQYSAVRLFVETAQRSQPKFQLRAEDAPAVARICRLVEGMPLALELAAASVRLRPCAVLASEIESNLNALSTNFPDLPERHRSVWAAFEQSWQLLSSAEQQVFCQMAVFRGGCGAAAARQVAGASPEILASLGDKSLLRRDVRGRYHLHELIRQYAGEKLAASHEGVAARRRHADYYLGLAQEADERIRTAEQAQWLDRLENKQENFRAAFEALCEFGETEATTQLCLAIFGFWYIRSHFSEGQHWIDQAIEHYRLHPFPGLLAVRLFNAAGLLAQVRGDFAPAQEHYQAALALSASLAEPRWHANLLNNLGRLALMQLDYDLANTLLTQSLAAFRAFADRQGIAASLTNLGQIALQRKDFTRTGQLLSEALAEWEALGYQQQIGYTTLMLAEMAHNQQDAPTTRLRLATALRLFQELKDRLGLQTTLIKSAAFAVSMDMTEFAARLLAAIATLAVDLETELPEPVQQTYQSALQTARARLEPAAFRAAWELGRRSSLVEAIDLAAKILNNK